MAKLAAWSISRKGGEEDARPPAVKRVERSHAGLEKHFKDWIAIDVTLIGEVLRLVDRQARVAVILRGCTLAGAGGVDP